MVCATVMFCFIIGAALGVLRFTQDTGSAIGVIGLLFTSLATTIGALSLVIRGEALKQATDDNSAKLDKVLNGDMHKIVEQSVTKVLHSWLTDEATRPSQHPPDHRAGSTPPRP